MSAFLTKSLENEKKLEEEKQIEKEEAVLDNKEQDTYEAPSFPKEESAKEQDEIALEKNLDEAAVGVVANDEQAADDEKPQNKDSYEPIVIDSTQATDQTEDVEVPAADEPSKKKKKKKGKKN
jgi:hypothetical protein